MEDALVVKDLTKVFPKFSLDQVSFTVPAGSVVGLIGENGSGKSTTVRCILGQSVPQSGTIRIYGIDYTDPVRAHEQIGAAFDVCSFPEILNARQVSKILKDIYKSWSEERFFELLAHFDIDPDRKIRDLSRGMKAKVSLCSALCHNARLLILDEATSGLDPVVREEMLDLLQEFMKEEDHSILMTSHISSDLEKIADYIVCIQNGKIVFNGEKETIFGYGIARLREDQLEFVDPALILSKRHQPLCIEVLIKDRFAFARRYPDYAIDPATLDDVVLMLSKGETTK